MSTLILIISILGGVQGLFLVLLLLRIRQNANRANKYLAVLVFLLSITLVIVFFHFNDLILQYPHFLGITQYFPLLYGPLLLLYVYAFFFPERKFTYKQFLHFLPFLILFVDNLPYLLISGERKTGYATNIFVDRFRPQFDLSSIILILHFSIYLTICIVVYRRFQKKAISPIQNSAAIHLRWLRNILLVSASIWGIYLFVYFYQVEFLNTIIPILLTVSVYAMGYAGFKHPELFKKPAMPEAKYKSSRLTAAEKDVYRKKVLKAMQEQAVYTDPNLSLEKLAHFIRLSTHELSQIINEEFNQNFADFVNSFRVEAAKRKLADENTRHLTILAIAYEVGFNSKSAFYAAFKKLTHQSPSEFLKSQHIRQSDSIRQQ